MYWEHSADGRYFFAQTGKTKEFFCLGSDYSGDHYCTVQNTAVRFLVVYAGRQFDCRRCLPESLVLRKGGEYARHFHPAARFHSAVVIRHERTVTYRRDIPHMLLQK